MSNIDTTKQAVEQLADELPETNWGAPRLYRAAAMMRALLAERDRLAAEVARLTAALEREEKSHEATINQRDRAEDAADKLSQAIGGYAVGDHSNINCPWANALSMGIDMSAEIARLTAALAQSRAETQAALVGCVKVAPLVWADFHDRGAKAQAWNEANYMIQKWSDGRWEISASYPGYSTFIYGTDRFYPTIEAAKAAAQADYEARILAAIQPDTSKLAMVREAFGNLVNHDVFQDEEYLSEDLIAKLSAARAALATIGDDPRHD